MPRPRRRWTPPPPRGTPSRCAWCTLRSSLATMVWRTRRAAPAGSAARPGWGAQRATSRAWRGSGVSATGGGWSARGRCSAAPRAACSSAVSAGSQRDSAGARPALPSRWTGFPATRAKPPRAASSKPSAVVAAAVAGTAASATISTRCR
ncbi:hypothetical protein FGB62_121g02 [Gracilaria domingensis]|nr:hypothetical protein FGB62_121g02 [Gracilaria domingensis]